MYCSIILTYIMYSNIKQQPMKAKPRRVSTFDEEEPATIATISSTNTNDVSFSIPDWRQQEIKSISQQYQKDIYKNVQVSLTDFDSRDIVQFLTDPKKTSDQKFAYERMLIHSDDFCILAFILCLEQELLEQTSTQAEVIEKYKKKINELDLCSVSNIPFSMRTYYENKIVKKILFQYINKGSYNVSLLEILLRRNAVLKFSLSLISKAILKKRGIITSYGERIPFFVEMRNCADEFGVVSNIKIRQKYIQTGNFVILFEVGNVKVLRKQNIIKVKQKIEKTNSNARSLTPPSVVLGVNKHQLSRKNTKDTRDSRSTKQDQSDENSKGKQGSKLKRSSSLMNFIKKFVCF